MKIFREPATAESSASLDRREVRLGKHASVRLELADDDLSPLAASIIDYWYRSRPNGGVPDRQAFDPVLLARWLGYLCVYEFQPDKDDFRNRLEGTYVGNLTGENWTGRQASDVDARFGSNFLAELRETRDTGEPIVHLVQIFQKHYSVAERILLPVSREPGGDADQIFVALFAHGFRPTRKM